MQVPAGEGQEGWGFPEWKWPGPQTQHMWGTCWGTEDPGHGNFQCSILVHCAQLWFSVLAQD